jgi:GT2 family glycosyltransferase
LRKIAILIPNFNGESFILETIKVLRIGMPNVDILVVDDCSKDNSVQVLKDNLINTIVRNENAGFGAAVNTGICELKVKGYQFVLVCNSDISPNIEQCSRILNELDSFAVVGNLGVVGFLETQYSDNIMRYQPPNISGFLFWLKISIIDEVGFFDERFYMYGEETDFFRRVMNSGFSIRQSNIYVYHLCEGSGKSRIINSWFAIRNSIYLEAKNHNLIGTLKKIILLEMVIIGVKGVKNDPSVQRVRRPGIIMGTLMLITATVWNLYQIIFYH